MQLLTTASPTTQVWELSWVTTDMLAIERMSERGWRRVRAVRLQALEEDPDAFGSTLADSLAFPDEVWRERSANPEVATWLAVLDSQDVGLVVARPVLDHPGTVGLYAMWVNPDARDQEVGGRLVEEVITWARTANFRRILLEVNDDNPAAIRLYARHGFEPTGVTDCFPPPRTHLTLHERALNLEQA